LTRILLYNISIDRQPFFFKFKPYMKSDPPEWSEKFTVLTNI